MPTIAAGINQALMLSLSMVRDRRPDRRRAGRPSVYSGINRLDVGMATTAGVAIVVIAISVDRIGRALSEAQHRNRADKTKGN